MLQFLLTDYLDTLMISESKLDGTFPYSQFQIYGFRTPYRLDGNDKGAGILLFVREDLITRLLSRHSFPHDIEILFVELNLRNKKCLICCCYNPPKNLIKYHPQELGKGIQKEFKYTLKTSMTFYQWVTSMRFLKPVSLLFVNNEVKSIIN